METHCISCSMPLEKEEDVKAQTEKGPICEYCLGTDGKVKSCEEVFEDGVQFFMNSVPGVDRELAEKVTRKNMRQLPQWADWNSDGSEHGLGEDWSGEDYGCLRDEEATDEEFANALGKLHMGQEN
jgi:hypothetical protein